MPLSQSIVPHIPSLRRFARALLGSREAGDACIVSLLRALVADQQSFPRHLPDKVALYRAFLQNYNGSGGGKFAPAAGGRFGRFGGFQALTPKARQAFLLMSVEGFSVDDIADILALNLEQVIALIGEADQEIEAQVPSADVLIIEDEPLTALHLEEVVEGLGHHVSGVARTHKNAVELARQTKPDLVLSDIRLAGHGSGLDAVNEILSSIEVPVIFITAYADKFASCPMPEPAFVIEKPYTESTVKAVIGQALFLEARSKARMGEVINFVPNKLTLGK